jgi:site-specific recombinase XerC
MPRVRGMGVFCAIIFGRDTAFLTRTCRGNRLSARTSRLRVKRCAFMENTTRPQGHFMRHVLAFCFTTHMAEIFHNDPFGLLD